MDIVSMLAKKDLSYLKTDGYINPSAADHLIEFMLNEDLIISEPESEQYGVKIKYRISI